MGYLTSFHMSYFDLPGRLFDDGKAGPGNTRLGTPVGVGLKDPINFPDKVTLEG